MDSAIKTSVEGGVQRSTWRTIAIASLAFWLSSSVLLDFIVMPSLYTTGMLSSPEFVPAGYSLFWVFNRVEMLCAALGLTSVWVLRHSQDALHRKGFAPLLLGAVLMMIPLLYTYVLAPTMSALSLDLTLIQPIVRTLTASPEMLHLQVGYWSLEVVKLAIGSVLLGLCCGDRV